MKLVHDADNVEELPVYNFTDIAACARKFADQLEAGEQGEPRRVILVLDTPNGVTMSMWGDAVTGYELMGILEVAKFRAYETNMGDGE